MVYIYIIFMMLTLSFSKSVEINKLFNFFIFLFMLLFLSIRYGQGTDYFAYKKIYLWINNTSHSINPMDSYNYNVDPLFYYIILLALRFNLGYHFIITVSSCICCVFIYLTIDRYSKKPVLSWFIFFANYYLNFTSMLRQSIAMSILLLAVCNYIKDKKLGKYIIWLIIAGGFHFSAFLCITIPLILKFNLKYISNYYIYSYIGAGCLVLSLFTYNILYPIVSAVYPKYLYYLHYTFSINVLSCGLRYFCCMLFIYTSKNADKFNRDILKLILTACLFFFIVNQYGPASRIIEYCMFFEIIYVANTIKFDKKDYACIVFILLYLFLFIKDLKSYEYLGGYKSLNFYDYPYITVLDASRIKLYK